MSDLRGLILLRDERPGDWQGIAASMGWSETEIAEVEEMVAGIDALAIAHIPEPKLPKPNLLPVPADPGSVLVGAAAVSAVRGAAHDGMRSVREIASFCWLPESAVEIALCEIASERASKDADAEISQLEDKLSSVEEELALREHDLDRVIRAVEDFRQAKPKKKAEARKKLDEIVERVR